MSQQNKENEGIALKNGKVTNDDRVSKRSVAAIFPDQAAANAAVGQLMETEFVNAQIELTPIEMPDKGSYMVIVNAGERAIIALEILVNSGGDTNTNQPEQLAAQAESMRTLPRESA